MTDARTEAWKVTEARHRRAERLVAAIQEWQRLADRDQYPRSLVDICEAALIREYRLGKRRGNADA